jgi:hypothetical protein
VNTGAPLRWLRTLVLAVGATTIGAASHLLSGGTLTPAGVVCTVPVLVVLAWPLTRRERGWSTILGVQLAGQHVAHVLFGLDAPVTHAPALPADAWFYAHVLAAVLVATWLRRAERHAWAVARRTAAALAAHWRRLLALLERPEADHPEPAPPAVDEFPLRPVHPLRHSVIQRGPPLPA